MSNLKIEKSSFRDRSGFIYKKEDKLYRQINKCYKEHYDHLVQSGLYKKLVEHNLLIPHEEISNLHFSEEAFLVIQPDMVPYISYPYEWCFSQIKDAALTTLKIQRIALEYGMCLKDASAYNIQFLRAKPIFIDTLSFEKYDENEPWIAYKQFCQHFLAPLALMCYTDLRLNHLSKTFLDGIPLDLTVKLLPIKSLFNIHIFTNLFLHAKAQHKYGESKLNKSKIKFNKKNNLTIIDSLETLVNQLKVKNQTTQWEKYYSFSNYSDNATKHKTQIVESFIDLINPSNAIDIGANTGLFSRLVSKKGIPTISCDSDSLAIEKNYKKTLSESDNNCLPLIIDFVNPSPSIGWENKERLSFSERSHTDLIMALAILHHLSISNNLPLSYISNYLSGRCKFLIIEFIPKIDPQVKKLLANREDIFDKYSLHDFEEEFSKNFKIIDHIKVQDTERVIYLMTKL